MGFFPPNSGTLASSPPLQELKHGATPTPSRARGDNSLSHRFKLFSGRKLQGLVVQDPPSVIAITQANRVEQEASQQSKSIARVDTARAAVQGEERPAEPNPTHATCLRLCGDSQTDGQQQRDNLKSRRALSVQGSNSAHSQCFCSLHSSLRAGALYCSDFSIKKTNFSAS